MGDVDGERRRINELIGGHSGEGTAGDIADDIAASALGRKADGIECVDDLGERLDGEPVELDVLAYGDVGKIAGVLSRYVGDHAELTWRRGCRWECRCAS